jgi:hypothetical protein
MTNFIDFIFGIAVLVIISIPAILAKPLRKALLLFLGIHILIFISECMGRTLGFTFDYFVRYLYFLVLTTIIPYEILLLTIWQIIKLIQKQKIKKLELYYLLILFLIMLFIINSTIL